MTLLSKSASTSSRWLALLVWILVIFLFSTDNFSGPKTSGVIVPLLHWLFPALSQEGLDLGHSISRKMGHVLEFFVLGVLTWRAFRTNQRYGPSLWVFSALLVLVVAVGDEWHQSFVPSRTSSIVDVGYDFLGGMMALLMLSRLRHEPRTLYSHPVL